MKKTLLKGGVVVSEDSRRKLDVLLAGDKIAEIAENIAGDFDELIDVTGKYVLPGLIDVHVHLREPGHTHKEDFLSGTEAAVAGGITTVFDMPNTDPPTINAQLLDEKYALARQKALAHVGLYALAVPKTIDEVLQLKNIVGIKIYLGASTGGHEEEIAFLEDIFKKAADLGGETKDKVIVVHSEDGACIAAHAKEFGGRDDPSIHSKIRAKECAVLSTKQVCHLAKKYNARVHIAHVSTAEEISIIRKFKSDRLTCEVTPHHLFLNTEHYRTLGNRLRVNPPVRDKVDEEALWEGIYDGTVDMIATDHAPHTLDEKAEDYWNCPSGMPGLETSLALMLNEVNKEKFSLSDVVRLMAFNSAKYFDIKNKGRLKVGFDADICVVDMNNEMKVGENGYYTKCNWSPFSGWRLKGWPVMTFVSGNRVFKNGKILLQEPASTIF